MRGLSIVTVALALFTHLGAQAPAKSTHQLAKLGPLVGQRVPDFSLVDQTGATHTLQSILGPNGAMLVFYRSAEW